MLAGWLVMTVGVALCVTSQVTCHRGGGRGGGWGWRGWWGWDTDTSDACEGCHEYCNITTEDEVKGGCVCPDDFTCTYSHRETHYSWRSWRRYSQVVTYSVCERDEEEPEHWGPPCLVTKGDDVYDIKCPGNVTCSVGPITTVTGYQLTYCDYASSADVDRKPWWDWFCDADTNAWKHWCESDDWWGSSWYGWYPRWHCWRW